DLSHHREPRRIRFGSDRRDDDGRLGIRDRLTAVEAILDDLEREEVLALLAQDPPQPLDVRGIELAVARRRPLRIDEALALEEPDLRDGHVGELALEQREHLPDRHVRPVRHQLPRPVKNTSLNFPICTSSPSAKVTSSMRLRLTYVPFSEPTSRS